MTLVRWDPFRDLMGLHQRFNQAASGSEDTYGSWAPTVDIFERGEDLVIRAELPGVERDDIEVRVEDNTLMLSGERKREQEFDEANAYRLERVYGKFMRSFRLPKTVDASHIEASYKNGVLEVRLPKAEEAKPRKIEISAA